VQPPIVQAPVAPIVTEEPTSDEKTFAALAHVLQLVGWFIAPLIILLIKDRSKFVRFHAFQALFLQIAYTLIFGGLTTAFIVIVLLSGPATSAKNPPLGLFLGFPILWLAMMGGYVLVVVLAIVYATLAGRGEWAAYPLLGRLAARVSGVALP
jgi:uncharacterized Tic20 family protein